MCWHTAARYPTSPMNPPRSDTWIKNTGFPANADFFCFRTVVETCIV